MQNPKIFLTEGLVEHVLDGASDRPFLGEGIFEEQRVAGTLQTPAGG